MVSRRTVSLFGTALFLIAAPGTVAGLVPWWISRWRAQAPFFGMRALAILGVLLLSAGVLVLLDSFARFAWKGLGTPAPVYPTRYLVVSGLYRYVRNPMYMAVIWVIAGEALLLGSGSLAAYGALVWLCFHLFVVTYEEPTLKKTFGAEYKEFCRRVPRWAPRLRPWPS